MYNWEGIVISKVLTQKDVSLLLSSSCCDENIELSNVLSKFKNGISLDHKEYIKNKYKFEYNIIFTPEARIKLIEDMAKEWRQKEPAGKGNFPCELCGNTKSEDKFIIENIVNKKTLRVGTSCINKFPTMNKNLWGENIKTIQNYAKKSPKILERIILFNSRYEGGKGTISDWISKFNKFNIIFPVEYDTDLKRLNSKANKFYKDFIHGKINEEELNQFQNILSDYSHLYNKFLTYNDNNISSKYVCTKEIEEYLLKLGMNVTLNSIKNNNSNIKKEFAKYIHNKSFIERFIVELDSLFSYINTQLLSIDSTSINLSFNYKTYESLSLYIENKIFAERFSSIFYNEKIENLHSLYKEIRVKKEYTTLRNFLAILDKKLNKNYYIRFDESLFNLGRCELIHKKEKKYAEINLDLLIKQLSQILYLSDDEIEELLSKWLDGITYWKNNKDKDKYNIGNLSEVWTK